MTRGFFAIGIYMPKHEVNIGTLMRSAFLYDAAMVFTVGRRYRRQASDTTNTMLHTPLVHCADIDDLVEHLPNSTPLVGVELDERSVPLNEFTHPQRAVYLLGAEDNGLPRNVLDRCHDVVQIPTPRPWSMNVATAGAVLLHDRYMRATVGNTAADSHAPKQAVNVYMENVAPDVASESTTRVMRRLTHAGRSI